MLQTQRKTEHGEQCQRKQVIVNVTHSIYICNERDCERLSFFTQQTLNVDSTLIYVEITSRRQST